MIKILVKEFDGRLVIFLPPEAVTQLNVGVGDELALVESPNGLELVPAGRIAEQIDIARDVMQEDAEALKKLSD